MLNQLSWRFNCFGILHYVIEVRNLTKLYGYTKALEDVSFKVNTGEVVGLLGPNGAGKTTTLNIITGVLFPNEGQVYVNGQKLADRELDVKRQIGYLAEDNPLYTSLNVSESLQLAAELKGMERGEYLKQRARVVEVTGLGSVLTKSLDALSKGFRQRLGLAQALINNPAILILDEPTEGLDPNQRQEIRDLIKNLGQDHTVLLSTHVMQEVEAICQRVVVLNQGRVVAADTVSALTQGQAGQIQIEIEVAGDAAAGIRTVIRDQFEVEDDQDQVWIVKLHNDQITDFYRLVGEKTSGSAYVTRLNQRQEKLEDVFRRLTQ